MVTLKDGQVHKPIELHSVAIPGTSEDGKFGPHEHLPASEAGASGDYCSGHISYCSISGLYGIVGMECWNNL